MMLAAVCPITAVYANSRTPESLTIFLMVLCLWFISKSLIYNKGLYFFGAGLASILMGYSRPEFFSFIFIFGLLLFLLNLKKRNKLKVLLLYAAGIAIIMVPWTLRNYSLTGRFIPLSLGGARGISFYLGTLEKETYCDANFIKFLNENPEVKQLFYERYQYGPLYDSSVTYDEYCKYEDIFTKMAIDRISSNPWGYLLARLRTIPRVWINLHANEFTFLNTQKLRLFHPDLRKIVYFTREDPKQVLILIAKYVLFAINIFYLLMALKGLWVLRARLLGLIFIIAPLIYAQALFMVIVISANYTVPYWPSIIFFSGVGYSYTFGLKKLERTES
jgi:hypothetical protein